jgi:hypothetical protein
MATRAGDSNDTLTAIPLHPGMTFQQEVDSPICGKKAKINLYNAPYTATMADYVTWYKTQLKGFHYFHQNWDNRPQEVFYSADGTKGVTLTGVPKGDKVFAASYASISPGLNTHEMQVFSPTNPSCK